MSATTPPPRPPGERMLSEQASDVQWMYRRWLDTREDTDRDDFIDATLDLLERITGESVPPGLHDPDGIEMDAVDYRGEH